MVKHFLHLDTEEDTEELHEDDDDPQDWAEDCACADDCDCDAACTATRYNEETNKAQRKIWNFMVDEVIGISLLLDKISYRYCKENKILEELRIH